MPSPERGFMIAEAVSAMNFEYHLKLLARERDRRTKRKKKEAVSAATEATSKGLIGNKTYDYCSTDVGVCQVNAELTTPQSLRDSSPGKGSQGVEGGGIEDNEERGARL